MRTEVVSDGQGRRVVEKWPETPAEAARLRREADVLEVAGHPGLVELIAFHDGPEPRLITAYVDGPTLAEGRWLDGEEVAGVVAGVASTLVDLHALGLVHGAIAPHHVLLDGEGRPVLCSLGYGGLAGERPSSRPTLPAPFTDPARVEADRLDPAVDVYGLGALLSFLLTDADGWRGGSSAESLRRVAAEAMAPDPSHRPSARQVADSVHDAVAGARLPGRRTEPTAAPHPGPPVAPPRERPLERLRSARAPAGPIATRRRLALGAAASIAVGGLVWVALVPAGRGGTQRRVAAPATVAPATVASATVAPAAPDTTEMPPRPTVPEPLRPGCPSVDYPLSADVDGDGCADAVRFADGVVEAAGSRWSVGQAGDLVAVGDWLCLGTPSLAVLRPATGDVFAFAGWAAAGQELSAPRVATVGGGTTLRAADLDRDGCHELVVERVTGAPAVVRVPRAAP